MFWLITERTAKSDMIIARLLKLVFGIVAVEDPVFGGMLSLQLSVLHAQKVVGPKELPNSRQQVLPLV